MPETLPLRDAAARLSISERTARRRLKEGTLSGQQVATPQGFRWLVELPETALIPTAADFGQVVTERDAYREVIAELRSELVQIRQLLEAAATRQLVNPAPAGQTEAPPPSERRRRWWRWLVWS